MKNSETFEITTPTDNEVLMSREFDAPRSAVFDAYTKPQIISKWMLGPEGWTMPVCEIDARPRGKWHFVWRKSDGTEMAMHGEYQEVNPPERIVSTESWGGDWPETLNTVVLYEKEGKTLATTTILYPSREARDAAMKTGMKDGVAMSYDRLEGILSALSRGASPASA